MLPPRDHLLPPDPEAYRRAPHPRGRVIVIAPTRAACETIELALRVDVVTILEREHGAEIRELARSGKGFGIVAGTGTGKTLALRPIAEAILQEPLAAGVVNREREATPETPSWNLVIVTTGIARRWFQDDLITRRDTVVVDEIHQTSAELELCLALGKRTGCRFIWLSATVDPAFYTRYLQSASVLETTAFDARLKAKVRIVAQRAEEFLDDRFIRHAIRERRGVVVFVPTRAEVEQLAADLHERWPRLNAAFYHGGEPIRVIRPFLEGQVERPFLLAMTAAGQSALNLPGLDTVVIYDARYATVVERGRNVLHRLYLGANEILQMAGRVHGRVPGGEVTILSDRELDFAELRPTPPEFQLAGDAERVAISCAALGVDAGALELPVPLDRAAYAAAVRTLIGRGLVDQGRLTAYGREVEALPVERPWGELLIQGEAELLPLLAVCANIESLHRMTREERDLHGMEVAGSDHLTAYNLYAEAVNQHGFLGEVYGLPRHLFEEGLQAWGERRGVLIKAVEDAALGAAAVYRAVEQPLPARLPYASRALRQRFTELLARVMPFHLVFEGRTPDGQEVRIARTSVAQTPGAVAGTLRYFADRFGVPRASIEGTVLPHDLIRRYARRTPARIELRRGRGRVHPVLIQQLTYGGFELESLVAPLPDQVPPDLLAVFRDTVTEALLAGRTVHPQQEAVRHAVEELGELWRRSGGGLAPADPEALRADLRAQLDGVTGWPAFLRTTVSLDVTSRVDPGTRAALRALPSSVRVLGDAVPVDYQLEAGIGVAVIRLREGQARRLRERDLPLLDRPLRLAVAGGRYAGVRAASLEALREQLREHPAHRRVTRARSYRRG